jgi:hypothetical protein
MKGYTATKGRVLSATTRRLHQPDENVHKSIWIRLVLLHIGCIIQPYLDLSRGEKP